MSSENNKLISLLRPIAMIVLMCGALASLGLVLNAGRHTPALLLILFIGWVLSPFIALLIAYAISKRWLVIARVTLYSLMLIITIGSLVGYSGVWSPPGTKPAAVFLIVPLSSWVIMVIVIPIVSRLSRGRDNI